MSLYGLLIGISIIVSLLHTEVILKKQGFSEKNIYSGAIFIILCGIIGARIYHVITDWYLYTNASLLDIIALQNGGLGIYGAIIGGMIGLFIVLLFMKVLDKTWILLDTMFLILPLAQAIGRWGNFFNYELYGKPTDLPWGIYIPENKRFLSVKDFETFHPLFLYESLLLLILFGILQWMYRVKKIQLGSKLYTALYFITYGAIRFFLEFLRIQSSRFPAPYNIFTIAQFVSILLIGVGIFIYLLSKKNIRNDIQL